MFTYPITFLAGGSEPPFEGYTETFTTPGSGNISIPVGATTAIIEIYGAGGGAGEAAPGDKEDCYGDSGAGGAYCKRNSKDVSGGGSLAYTLGAAGLGATAYNTDDATAGGDTTIDGMTAGGGEAGSTITSQGSAAVSAGGTATGGDVNTNGSDGTGGYCAGSTNGGVAGGDAGGPEGGSGGAANLNTGEDGTPPGGGGSSPGGNGADGRIKIQWS